MQQSFTKNYIYIYFFQFLSILLGFASLFVVVPSLSSNPTIYGIYSVCTSITVFLSYADLGFLGAGTKYAAEYYAQNKKKEEIEIIGFSHFILLIVVLLIAAIFLFLSFNPQLLIKDIEPGENADVARKLLLILALFSPTVVFQRMVQMIFNIRLQEYKIQRVSIVGNLLKISSVLFFFGNGRYDIVGYYLFFNIINVLVLITNIIQAKVTLNYSVFEILPFMKFSRPVFEKVKNLAFSTLFATICWVVFYELDSIVIGRTLGAEAVAIYAIGLTMIGFVRSIMGVFFTPFAARFNHFVGLKEEDQLKRFYMTVMQIMFFIVVIPLLSVAIMARPITLSWVGMQYEASIPVVIMLVLCNIMAFVSYPAGNLLIAKEEVKTLYVFNGIQPLVYWIGVASLISIWGVYAFPFFKLAAFLIAGVLYVAYSLRFLDMRLGTYLKMIFVPYIPAILSTVLILLPCRDLFATDKSTANLLYNGIIVVVTIAVAFGVSYFTVKPLRNYVLSILKKKSEV